MADVIVVYISAASDLELEREVLNRAITEIPTTLAWRIILTPLTHEEPDLRAVADADVQLLLLGSDVRAPVGVEWAIARRARKMPTLWLKQAISRTQAAHAFMKELERHTTWRFFSDIGDLRRQALLLLVDHILSQQEHYNIKNEELDKLSSFRKKLAKSKRQPVDDTRGGAGNSSIILSTERYIPSNGVLLTEPEQ
jgi:hypothetical protein